jgi:phosphonate transport system permease protein
MRRWALIAAAAIVAVSLWVVLTAPGDVTLRRSGFAVALAFLSRAFTPALAFEGGSAAGTLLLTAIEAARVTVTFAAAAMTLALGAGLVFAFLASTAWWEADPVRSKTFRGWVLSPGPLLYGPTRVVIAVLRSVHELLWAVMLLAAFGLGHFTAVLAIAIPYSAILGKVFSEMVDEAPRAAAQAMRDAGASPLQAFLVGLVPRAFPDMAAYALYRFECALRSSAVLGFFGFPTLGYFIAASFENLHYGEVWTYLYTMFVLIAVMDWWSGALRRRFVV